mmetsp:Transcript_48153/g.76695  ORF Transcript_48153/g.76695 Transcript_48153/m.76695 type:complete len:215 (-) Transcript_48153:77-721(-)
MPGRRVLGHNNSSRSATLICLFDSLQHVHELIEINDSVTGRIVLVEEIVHSFVTVGFSNLVGGAASQDLQEFVFRNSTRAVLIKDAESLPNHFFLDHLLLVQGRCQKFSVFDCASAICVGIYRKLLQVRRDIYSTRLNHIAQLLHRYMAISIDIQRFKYLPEVRGVFVTSPPSECCHSSLFKHIQILKVVKGFHNIHKDILGGQTLLACQPWIQ